MLPDDAIRFSKKHERLKLRMRLDDLDAYKDLWNCRISRSMPAVEHAPISVNVNRDLKLVCHYREDISQWIVVAIHVFRKEVIKLVDTDPINEPLKQVEKLLRPLTVAEIEAVELGDGRLCTVYDCDISLVSSSDIVEELILSAEL